MITKEMYNLKVKYPAIS